MSTGYEINYEDERFKSVETDKQNALSDVEKTYSGLIEESDGYYQKQIDAAKEWEQKQTELQNEQTDFAIEKIEQQKEQEKKDYLKEQSGAYVDWQKQSNEYGANAEAIASQGLNLTGYSESSQVSMYNTYQNRLSSARESYNQAVLNYNNAITEARLQNSSALAEIAYQSLQTQLELSLEGFQYKNTLLLEQANKKLEVDQMYHQRWQDVLDQMNTENALAEEIRQFNESLAEEQRQFNATHSGGGGGGYSYSSGGSSKSSESSESSSESAYIEKDARKRAADKESSSGSDSGSGTKVNTQSILDLGYGPISASTLNSKVASGEVKETVKNNTISFSKTNTNTNKSTAAKSSTSQLYVGKATAALNILSTSGTGKTAKKSGASTK